MNNFLRHAVEQRRKTIINILLALNIYQNEEELEDFSLIELEQEFKRICSNSHPHSESGSIRWKRTK